MKLFYLPPPPPAQLDRGVRSYNVQTGKIVAERYDSANLKCEPKWGCLRTYPLSWWLGSSSTPGVIRFLQSDGTESILINLHLAAFRSSSPLYCCCDPPIWRSETILQVKPQALGLSPT